MPHTDRKLACPFLHLASQEQVIVEATAPVQPNLVYFNGYVVAAVLFGINEVVLSTPLENTSSIRQINFYSIGLAANQNQAHFASRSS